MAVKLLRTKFVNGEITGRENPKAVWEAEPVFQKHKLTNFRACYNNMKRSSRTVLLVSLERSFFENYQIKFDLTSF